MQTKRLFCHLVVMILAMVAPSLFLGLAFAQLPDARVVALTGTLTLKQARQRVRVLRLYDTVGNGDELSTDERSEATIQTSTGATVHIYPSSRVLFSEHSADIREFLHLFFGSIKVHVQKLTGWPNPHTLTTPSAIIAVRGTTFSVFVDDEDTTLVAVDEGIVSVASVQYPSNEVILRRGQRTWVRLGQTPTQAGAFRGRSERADIIPAHRRGVSGSVQSNTNAGLGQGMTSMSHNSQIGRTSSHMH